MDYSEREAQRRKEDRNLNRGLLWVGAAIILEFLLVLVNKYYINYRTTQESINRALAIDAGLHGLRWVSLAALVLCAAWALVRLKRKGKTALPLTLTSSSCVAFLGSQIILGFQDAGVQMLFWLVPACAALALIFYLYQRDFFFSALSSGAGILGLWFIRHVGAKSLYTLAAAAVIAGIAVLLLWMRGHGGALLGKGEAPVFPEEAGYPLMLVSCGVSLLAMAAAAAVGGVAAYYLLYAMIAWLFALLVYYTVKMM